MSSKRSGIAAVSINDSIYVFGSEERAKMFNNNEKYDVINNRSSIEPPISTARHGLAAVDIGDKYM